MTRTSGATERVVARREELALTMYTGGATVSDIADELGMTVGGAHAVVRRSMRKHFPPAENLDEWRQDKIAQLDVLIDRLWPRADDEKVAAQIIRAIDKQADLIGVARYTASDTTITVEHVRSYKEYVQSRLEVIRGELLGSVQTEDTA